VKRLRLSAAVLLGLVIVTHARADVSPEYAEKAAYIAKFIPFITWPEVAFAVSTAPVTICVQGADPFEGKLEQAAGQLKSGDRPIAVRYLPAPDPSTSCQVIFLGKGDEAAAEGTLDSVKGKPVVTVTDSGLKAHGMISFVVAAHHVRFDIDEAAAAQDGVTISSKLLRLARVVKPRGPP